MTSLLSWLVSSVWCRLKRGRPVFSDKKQDLAGFL